MATANKGRNTGGKEGEGERERGEGRGKSSEGGGVRERGEKGVRGSELERKRKGRILTEEEGV